MSTVAIERAAATIRAGGVVAFPTETFYGLGADPHQPAALDRVLRLKGRGGEDKPLLLLAASLDQVAPWVGDLPPGFDTLVARFWPGPLTLVLPAAPDLPPSLVGPGGGVAVRISPHPLARRLCSASGTAITGTSANRTDAPPARTAAAVRAAFGDRIDAVIDGGTTPGGAPSTLVELTPEGARLLRAGALAEAALAEVIELAP